jgi:hypothetical protein
MNYLILCFKPLKSFILTRIIVPDSSEFQIGLVISTSVNSNLRFYYGFRYYNQEFGRWLNKDPANGYESQISTLSEFSMILVNNKPKPARAISKPQ